MPAKLDPNATYPAKPEDYPLIEALQKYAGVRSEEKQQSDYATKAGIDTSEQLPDPDMNVIADEDVPLISDEEVLLGAEEDNKTLGN